MKRISEETLLPIGLVITIVGAVFWLSSLYFETKIAADEIKTLKDVSETRNNVLIEINKRLSRIEGKLGISGQ